MRLGVNLLGLPLINQGGAGMLARMELEAFADRGVELTVLAEPAVAAELDLGGARIVAADGPGRGRFAAPAMRILTPFGYRYKAIPSDSLAEVDVVHYPLGFMAAPKPAAATVVTAVDLQHVYWPEFFSRRERMIRSLTWHRAFKEASRVAVYTEAVKQSLIERIGIPGTGIDVVGACCDQRFYADNRTGATRGRYLIYPASPRSNKNHETLLKAFKQALTNDPDLSLILVGPLTHDWSSVESAIEALGLRNTVEIRGHVSIDELVDLYRGALALVFPSLFEGFGLPVLEAMAMRCPAVVSNISAVREICGEDAIVVDPEDEGSIAEGIRRVAEAGEGELDSMVERAARRAEYFRPERHADRLLDCFDRALDTMSAK